MGAFPKNRCQTNELGQAPNPSPSHYSIKELIHYSGATYAKVHYIGCTNFEGIKILVFKGRFTPSGDLDPHFSDTSDSPIARFKPSIEGQLLAKNFAKAL